MDITVKGNIEDYINKDNFGDKINVALHLLSELNIILNYEFLDTDGKIKILKSLITLHDYLLRQEDITYSDTSQSLNGQPVKGKSVPDTIEILMRVQKWFYHSVMKNELNTSKSNNILELKLYQLQN